MPVMAAVWPVTGLYLGPVAVWDYRCLDRPSSTRWRPNTAPSRIRSASRYRQLMNPTSVR
jgi:hypothetical protein